ncbi:MAG: alanine racemase [Clostridia bacterium]|nr:alanine racemase [Clostridia bacterium]
MKIDVKINLKQIAQNIKAYKGRVIFMVKGDAYGHGLVEVSKYAEPLVYGFGVATVDEGITLRENGVEKPVLVCQCLPFEIERALKYRLTPTISNFDTLFAMDKLGGKCAVKINTGMNRFGFDQNQIEQLKDGLNALTLSGVYSHIYSRDSKEEQCALFDEITKDVAEDIDKHIYASSTAPGNCDIVRIGFNGYKGAMTVESRVVAVRLLEKGDNVGYSCTMPEKGYVAWIFGGYADGINRERPQPVLINGKICPVVAVCMDTFCAYTGEYESKVGEVVVLQNKSLTPEYIANETNTIPYVVMTNRVGRVKRIYTQ